MVNKAVMVSKVDMVVDIPNKVGMEDIHNNNKAITAEANSTSSNHKEDMVG